MKQIKFLSIVLAILLTSCASKKIPFSSDIQAKYNLPEEKLKKVQFYTSETIILYKSKSDGDLTVRDGKILMLDTKDCERVVIKKGTPCILESVNSPSQFIVSFEFGEGKLLAFGSQGEGFFSLEAKDWKDGVGTLKYAGKSYVVEGGGTYLLVKAKKLNKLSKKQRTVVGRKV